MSRLVAPLAAWIERTLPDADPAERARAMVLVAGCVLAAPVLVAYRFVEPASAWEPGRLAILAVAVGLLVLAPALLRLTRSLDVALVSVLFAVSTPVLGSLLDGDLQALDNLLWLTLVPVLGALLGRSGGFAMSVVIPLLLALVVLGADRLGWLVNGERASPARVAVTASGLFAATAVLLVAHRLGVRRAEERLEQAQRDLERARVAAAQADRLATVGALATGVAHGVNNPLQAALDGVRELEGLLEGEPGSPTMRARGVTAEIGVALHQIRATVAALATFAEPVEQGHGAPVDLDELVRQVVSAVRNAAPDAAEFRVRMDELPAIHGHRNELAQVLLVLLRNASQAGDPARGAVSIDVVGGRTPAGGAFLEVRDDGVGMTDEVLERALEPFFTTRGVGQGAGLGLPLANNVVRHLGGTLELRSREGMGTLARLVLPPSLTAEPAAFEEGPAIPPGARLLIVDDEPLPLRVVGRALAPHFEVELELSPERALQRLMRGETFDLVLSDLMMPGLTGDELYARAVEVRPDLAGRFVFITGAVLDGEQKADVRATGLVVIQKPFDRDELVDLVSRVVSSARAAAREPTTPTKGSSSTPTPH